MRLKFCIKRKVPGEFCFRLVLIAVSCAVRKSTRTTKVSDYDDNCDDDVEAHGQSQVSGNNATLTRALSAESLMSQSTISSPKFCRGQFHIYRNFSYANCTFCVKYPTHRRYLFHVFTSLCHRRRET